MNLDRFLGFSILLGLIVILFMYVLSPQPQFNYDGFYQPAIEIEDIDAPVPSTFEIITPDDININNNDFENFEKLPSLKDKINLEDFNGLLYQVGAFSKNETALNLAEQFKSKGFPANIDNTNNLFYVKVGPFLNQEDLENNMDTVHKIAGISEGKILVWKP